MTDTPAGLTDEELGREWRDFEGYSPPGYGRFCPFCGAWETQGHEDSCAWALLRAERTKSRELEVDAAAMREALQESPPIATHPDPSAIETMTEQYIEWYWHMRSEALSSSAGQSLLDELRQLREVAEAARDFMLSSPEAPLPGWLKGRDPKMLRLWNVLARYEKAVKR